MLVNGSFSVATDFTKNSCSGFSRKKPGNLKQDHEREEGCRKARLGVGGRVPESQAWSGRKCRKARLGVEGRVPENEAWSRRKVPESVAWSRRKSAGKRGLE